MKNLRYVLIMAIVLFSAGTEVYAQTFSVDGISYKITNATKGTVGVDRGSNRNYSGDIIIPATVTYQNREYKVTSLGYGAFYNCSELNSVTIGANVTGVAQAVFTGCMALTRIDVDPANTYLSSVDGVLFGAQGSLLIKYPAARTDYSYVVPEGVSSIMDFAFEYTFTLCQVSFPQSLKLIGQYAFQNTPIESVTLPDGITTLGRYAFYNCPYLATVNTGGLTEIPDFAFNSCGALSSLTMGAGVKSIGEYAFFSCKELTSVALAEGLTTIGAGAFKSCETLRSVTLPSTVVSVGATAFSFCKSMRSIKVAEANTVYCDWDGVLCDKARTTIIEFPCGYPGEYEIPEGITVIGDRAFYYRSRLTEITMPASLRRIENSAFHGCAFTSVSIPDGVNYIGSQAFMFCEALTSVRIGAGVSRMEPYAFGMCYALRQIDIYASNPPVVADENAFSTESYTLAQLNVPQGSKDAYKDAFAWAGFRKLADPLEPAGIGVVRPTSSVDDHVGIYSITGQLIYNGPASAQPDLPAGIYIERRGGKTVKIRL